MRRRSARLVRCGPVLMSVLLVQVVAAGVAALPASAGTPPGRADRVAVSAAWRWIHGQLGTGTAVSTASTITPDRPYPTTWTGSVAGRFELVGVPPPPVVLDPSTGASVYEGLQVRQLVVTDTAYLIDQTPARADGTFSFPWSRPGAKVFQLTDETSGDVLAEEAPRTGLVRSFDVPVGDPLAGRTYTYDQSLALLAALSLGHEREARRMAAGLQRLQTAGGTQDGGFVVSAAALNPGAGLPEYRTGVAAVATYALLRYLAVVGPTDRQRPALLEAVTRAVGWLRGRQLAGGPLDGLLTGGHGADQPGVGFDPDIDLTWVSTEHNLDAWQALTLAGTVLDDPASTAAARRVDRALQRVLWVPGTGHFLQGWSDAGPDPTEALDVSSWGAIQLQATGRSAKAAAALRHTTLFASADPPVSGYGPWPPSGDPLVWVEGSAGVALAELRLGRDEAAGRTLRALAAAQLPTGAWPGATRGDPAAGMTSAPAVAATAWMVLVQQARSAGPSIWDQPAPTDLRTP